MTDMKTCRKCGGERRVNTRCQPCQRAYERERYPLTKHRYAERKAARARAWNAAHPERRRVNARRSRLRRALARHGIE